MDIQIQFTDEPVQYWSKKNATYIADTLNAGLIARGMKQRRIEVERIAPRKFGVKSYDGELCHGWISAKE